MSDEPFFVRPSTDPSIDNSELVECVNLIKHRFSQGTPQMMATIERLMSGFDMRHHDWVKIWFDRGVMNMTPGRRLLDIAQPTSLLHPSKKGPEDKDLVS